MSQHSQHKYQKPTCVLTSLIILINIQLLVEFVISLKNNGAKER